MAQRKIVSARGVLIMTVLAFALTATAMPATAQTLATSSDQPAALHDTWTTGANLPTAREGAAVAAIGKNIYVVGGITGLTAPSSPSTKFTSPRRTLGRLAPHSQRPPAMSLGLRSMGSCTLSEAPTAPASTPTPSMPTIPPAIVGRQCLHAYRQKQPLRGRRQRHYLRHWRL